MVAARAPGARRQHALRAQNSAVKTPYPTRAARIPWRRRTTTGIKAFHRVPGLDRPVERRVGAGLGHDLLDFDDAPGGAFARGERAVPGTAGLCDHRHGPTGPRPRDVLVPRTCSRRPAAEALGEVVPADFQCVRGITLLDP